MARSRRRDGAPSARPPAPVSALRGVALETGRYWRTESSALRRGLLAMFIAAVADICAGLVLGHAEGRLRELDGLLLLIPAAIAMRGATFGALGARLGTAIHTGQFETSLRRGSFLSRQLQAVVVLTMVTSLEAALLAKAFGTALGLNAMPLADLVTISVVGGILASVLLGAVTLGLARTAWSRDWNMDDVGAPTITATGDLLAVPALLVASLLVTHTDATFAIGTVLGVAAIASLGWGWLHPEPAVRRIVRESIVVLFVAAGVDVLAGVVVETRLSSFLDTPALLVLFPPFIATFGSLGGILSSRLTSKLHLGLTRAGPLPDRDAALDISVAFLFAGFVFAFLGFATWALAVFSGLQHPPLLTLLGVTLVGGTAGTVILTVVAYTASTATFRFGLDPDNQAIPIVTSTMDLMGMLCLVAALALMKVG